jgi:hypothetical protein
MSSIRKSKTADAFPRYVTTQDFEGRAHNNEDEVT